MAKMIPEISSKDIANVGERLVYEALKAQLPDDWVVRFHYPFCWQNKGALRDCEVDFVVISPERGLMFLEVKSSYGFGCEQGIWYRIKRNGQREKTGNPLEQVISAKHRVIERIAERSFKRPKNDFPGIYGHMVVYPKGEVVGKFPESAERSTIVTRSEMINLLERIKNNFKLWGSPSQGRLFTKMAMDTVCTFFEDNCRFIQAVAVDLDEDEKRINELTIAQYKAFQNVLSNSRLIISGPAGSGKTMIAEWAANAFARDGKRVLVLCFNKVLEAWLNRNKDELVSGVDVRSYFSLCREWVLEAGLPFNVPNQPNDKVDYFANIAPNIFSDALGILESSKGRYDVVLVDEAQDFHENWWISVQLLLKDPDRGGLYIFRDPGQSGVYGHGNAYPDSAMLHYELRENCRNTVEINQYSSNIVDRDIPSFEMSPIGNTPVIVSAIDNHGHRALAVRKAVSSFLEDGFWPDQIAVLSPFGDQHDCSSLSRLTEGVQGIPMRGGAQDVEHWIHGKVIWGSTIKAFKGLEADCIIITDIYQPDGKSLTESDLYVACTRAKHRLILIPMTNAVGEYLRGMTLN